MTPISETQAHLGRVFRLSYSSRATRPIHRSAATQLANDAADNNGREGVSGVLFSDHGLFLQWLEGPAPEVCSVMSRITADPRHTDVTLHSAGWISDRRYSDWAMQLAGQPLPGTAPGGRLQDRSKAPCDTLQALAAFDAMERDYYRERNRIGGSPSLQEFAHELIHRSPSASPHLPEAARTHLHARAQFVDDVCSEFVSGWREDHWTSIEVALGMAHLNLIWQRSGRVLQPSQSRQCVAVVVPPNSSECLGAIVKADLLRDAGIAVRMISAPSVDTTIGALYEQELDAIIVAGSRLGWSEDQKRAKALASRIRERIRAVPTYVGGHKAGSLDGWPERIALLRDDAAAMRATDVDWLALSQLATGTSGHLLKR
ncbi:MAG: BLUF domain-containing protein [Pseudomonadota bacterium]